VGWHFCFSSKNKKLKGAKNSKEKIFLWAILMFLRLALRAIRAPCGAKKQRKSPLQKWVIYGGCEIKD
jgi:hypothetical protein